MSTDALFAEAQRHHREGRVSEAEAIYRRLLRDNPGHADALHYLAVIDMDAGRFAEAEQGMRASLQLKPREPSIHVNLGILLTRASRPDEAAASFRAALALDPFRVGALLGLGGVLREQRRHEEAVRTARKAVAIEPRNARACALLGSLLQDGGQSAEAVEWLERAVTLKPEDARSHYNLGAARRSKGQIAEAMAAYRQALALDPGLAEAHNNLGVLLVDLEDAPGAVSHLTLARELLPGNAVVHNNLGRALSQLGRFGEAIACFGDALRLDPAYAEAIANIGAAERSLGRLEAAEGSLRRAIALKSDFAEAYGNLGLTLRDLGRLDEALASVNRALELRSDIAELHGNLGLVLNDLGRHREALASARRAAALKPGSAVVQRSLLGMLVYTADWDPAGHFADHRRYARIARTSVTAGPAHNNARDLGRRLRIGYVTSDLRAHPIARNMLPLFTHTDRERFQDFVYADIAAPNEMTRQCQSRVDQWRNVTGFSDPQLAQIIREDAIDILVLLAGRFDRNRPSVAAYRAAPVQVSCHDPATSGFGEIDYLIGDRVLVSPETRERFSERVLRLPSFYIHDPLPAPAVGTLPALATGFITFGVMNNPAKLSDEALALFAAALAAVPHSRLLFRFRDRYASAALRGRVTDVLGGAGVGAERIEIVERETPNAHPLDIYNRVDIGLDPTPFTGSTTTFESLWMGVPVVTLRGAMMVGRWSASMLKAVDLEGLVAETRDEYGAAAAGLARDLPALAALRAGLRQRVGASALCDGARRARQFERLYRAVWRRWCVTAKGS